jgi:hypothetical protein
LHHRNYCTRNYLLTVTPVTLDALKRAAESLA